MLEQCFDESLLQLMRVMKIRKLASNKQAVQPLFKNRVLANNELEEGVSAKCMLETFFVNQLHP